MNASGKKLDEIANALGDGTKADVPRVLQLVAEACLIEREWCAKEAEKHIRKRCRCEKGIGPSCIEGCTCPHHDVAEQLRESKQP